MISINKSKVGKVERKYLSSKPYKDAGKIILITYILFASIYIFRDNLYKVNYQYVTLFAQTAPNLIASLLFNLIGIFYVLPFFKGIDAINKPMYIWLANLLNIVIFLLIEYIHVVLNLGSWDNNDIVASLIGMIVSTLIYFKLKRAFIEICDK